MMAAYRSLESQDEHMQLDNNTVRKKTRQTHRQIDGQPDRCIKLMDSVTKFRQLLISKQEAGYTQLTNFNSTELLHLPLPTLSHVELVSHKL